MKDPIISGIDAPLIPVYCGLCDLPVYRLRFEAIQAPHAWAFWAQCCGKTVAARVPMRDVLRMAATGEKYYAVTGKGHVATVKKLARLEAPRAKRIVLAMPGKKRRTG